MHPSFALSNNSCNVSIPKFIGIGIEIELQKSILHEYTSWETCCYAVEYEWTLKHKMEKNSNACKFGISILFLGKTVYCKGMP